MSEIPHVNEFDDLPLHMRIEILNYAAKLKEKYPNMKPQRLVKKVVEKFNIKLVDNA